MKVVILAGGHGTRLSEETTTRPKPMVEIGGKPILWHIMHIYAASGYRDFLIACGYRGEMIKEYFRNFIVHNSDYVVDLKSGSLDIVNSNSIDWRIGVVDTGLDTQTGGRIRRLREWIDGDTFMVTYGDGLSQIDVKALVAFHRSHGKAATITAVHPPARFGALDLDGHAVSGFAEKAQTGEGWINGGFFVFESTLFDYLERDETILERDVLPRLARDGQLMAYRHTGFWRPMDTLREKQQLEELWASGNAPWKVWP